MEKKSLVDTDIEFDGKEISQILKRNNTANPSTEDSTALQKALDARPHVWQSLGNMNKLAIIRIVGTLANTELMRQSMHKYADEMCEQMGYEASSAIEKMLIDQIVLTYFDYYWVQSVESAKMKKGVSLQSAKFLEQKINGAQRRHIRAIETLARVRKMGFSGPMQINIAKNQTNFVQTSD